ncbi:MAG: flippase-like domain-containing protein [Acidimicrobiales bacterium]|nr:flippase-like domain-containing protein [Acidimicrobiales bacterium]
MAATAPPEGAPTGFLPVVTSVIERRWTSSVFGIVAEGRIRRRPSDIAKSLLATVVVGVLAAGAVKGTAVEGGILSFLASLPGTLGTLFQGFYLTGVVLAAALVVTALVARRGRLLGTLLVAGGVAWLVSAGLRELVDLPDALVDAGTSLHGQDPDFPVVPLATVAAVILAARPYLTRPARRLLEVVYWVTALGALGLGAGLPIAVVASLFLGWGMAAVAHLVFGSPAATPSPAQVQQSLHDLGVPTEGLVLAPEQRWGRSRYRAGPNGGLGIAVLGRDSTDARLFHKLWRFVWYKDSGPTLSLTREGQVEHEAYVLLLAARTGAVVPDVVAAGVAGARDDAVLVVRDPAGVPLTSVDAHRLTDEVLDAAWANLGHLHAARLAHGDAAARNVVLADDGTVGIVDLASATTSAGDHRRALDDVTLLATVAELVGVDRALDAAERALGAEGLAERLSLFQPSALTATSRRDLAEPKSGLKALAEAAADRTDTAVPDPAALRRFSLGSILLAGAFCFGLYLLIGQLVGVAEMGDIFKGAIWEWVLVTALLSQLPQFAQAVAMLGSVAAPLPLGPVVGVQFANSFTGLVGGTAGNATLVIRFFQRRGLAPAVAVSSGLLNSAAGFIVQATLVITGVLLGAATASTSSSGSGSSGGGVPDWVLALGAAAGLAVVLAVAVPRFRARIRTVVASQLKAAVSNIRGILATPLKAVQLFGGQIVSQVVFAMVLGAALHAYGESLPLMQLIVINSFASFIGGAMPVPGGMGVVETGLIAGFTAAGIPQAEATAATFTARMFTAYLPPIWGWFALQWLRRQDYV